MELLGIEEFMRYLKTKYDESGHKQDWRALSGRDHVSSNHDTFVFSDQKVFQIKSAQVAPEKMVAVASEVGGPSPDMLELTKDGSPIPLSVISGAQNPAAVIMFGMQQYSSDTADVFRREYYSSKQDSLKADLDRKVSNVIQRPEFRHAYRSLKDREEGYFA